MGRTFGGMGRGLMLVILCLVAFAALAPAAAADPNDPAWSSEWGPRLTRASDLWQLTTGDPRIVIAVVDTGLTPIPDLTQVVPGWDILGNDASTGDDFGHGTWVSSIIGAAGNNGIGIAGYCWKCSIMPVRVAEGREGAIAPTIGAGIRWAVDHGARIVNVSLASNGFDESELGAVEYAEDHGVLVIASAGNGGDTSPRYPAAYPGVLSVAGTDENDQLYDWSTRGPWVSVTAPGCEELLDAVAGPAYGCGSSFAPPAVAGIAGLLLSLDPGLTMYQVAGALAATAVPVAGVSSGRVDAWAAAHYLGLAPAAPPPVPTPTPTGAVGPSRQVLVQTDVVRKALNLHLKLDAGRLELQLSGPAAASCAMTMRAGGNLYADLPGERNVRSLGVTLTAGSYTVNVRCTGARPKPYELTAVGVFSD